MDVWTQSETVDPEVRAYVYSLVNAVGGRSTLDESYGEHNQQSVSYHD